MTQAQTVSKTAAPKAKANTAKRKPAERPLAKNGRFHLSTPSLSTVGKVAAATAGVASVAGAALFAWQRYRGAEDAPDGHATAFTPGETDRENFDQTRSAGPDAIRDETGADWDRVDQAADESFPASDPTTHY